jgi:hypothetical protein
MSETVRIVLLGAVKSPRGSGPFEAPWRAGRTLESVLVEDAGFRPADVRRLSVQCAGVRLGRKDPVPEGAVLEVMLPLGGG